MPKRTHYLLTTVFCAGMLSVALFFQLVVGLEPCPLCVFQRIALLFIGLVALVAFLHNPHGLTDRFYGALLVLGALGSLGIASRHVWLLSLPKDEAVSCGPGMEIWLDRFISYLPQGKVTETLFRSSAECSEVTWSLFGLGIPQLIFPVIVGFVIYLIWLFFKQEQRGFY